MTIISITKDNSPNLVYNILVPFSDLDDKKTSKILQKNITPVRRSQSLEPTQLRTVEIVYIVAYMNKLIHNSGLVCGRGCFSVESIASALKHPRLEVHSG